MNHVGALVGALLGLLLTRNPAGAVIGAVLGAILAGLWRSGVLAGRARDGTTVAMFALLGRLARADGRVDETEIALAESLMQRLALDAEGRRAAVEAFQRGKRDEADLAADYAQLRGARRHAPLLLDVFVDMALADGRLDPAERRLLGKYAWMLGVREAMLDALLARRQRGRPAAGAVVADPYTVLGISQDASDAEVRRTFRRLMSRHHPDKLAATGAAPDMIRLAQERTQAIIAAYDAIKSQRGLRG